MKKNAYPLILLLAAACSSTALQAQHDSAALDLGSVSLQKQFTQYISIKGEALEKMPFANLAEAINVWLYGAYSNVSTLAYVVDGNIVPDVNSWSVYDIEEVVLVQSALTQLTGNTGQQQLVLITTRRRANDKAGKWSFNAAGASTLVSSGYKSWQGSEKRSSEVNMYHQYYLSAAYSHKKLQAGISASWLRDVLPRTKSDSAHTYTPIHFNRFRLNAWANASLGRKNSLYVHLNAMPENEREHTYDQYSTMDIDQQQHLKGFILNPGLQLHTDLGHGLQNHFSASYQFLSRHNMFLQEEDMVNAGQSPVPAYETNVYDTVRDQILVIREHISQTIHAGSWTIEPAVYLQYAYMKGKYSYLSTTVGGVGTGSAISAYGFNSSGKGHIFTGAPSVNFSYKRILSFGGGGFAYLPPSGTRLTKAAIFPFAEFSFDVLKLANASAPSSLQLFASLARNYNYTFNGDAPYDFTTVDKPSTAFPASGFGVLTGTTGISPTPAFTTGDLYEPHTVWTLGLGFRRPGDKLVANYSFEKRGFTAPTVILLPLGGGYYSYPPLQAYRHHINVSMRLVTGGLLEWQSGITATTIKIEGTLPPYPQPKTAVGDLYGRRSWTGGWVNRITCKRFFAGADLLYHIGEYFYTISYLPSSATKINSIDLQNVYAGCKIRIGRAHEAEVYASGRNLLQNDDSDLTDGRRYYGVGFKTAL